MPFYTPLRYPGGKRRLAPAVMRLFDENGLKDVDYVEPYAGGASLALALLFAEYVAYIHINDLSLPVYAFWYSVLNHTEDLCKRIEAASVTMEEWYQQRAVYDEQESANLFDLGFATLFLNRTNWSGIIGGGVMGGKRQAGAWSLDVRFNKGELIQRIKRVGRYRDRIKLYHMDALTLTDKLLPRLSATTFVFYDPPYIEKGDALYLNEYTREDHILLARRIMQIRNPWVVTYDYEGALKHRLYLSCRRVAYNLSYSAQARYGGKEVMFLSDGLKLPAAWGAVPFNMASDRSEHPFYGVLEETRMPEKHSDTEEGPEVGKRPMKAPKAVSAVPKSAVPPIL